MKAASATYVKLMREMGMWYNLWQKALPTGDAEYLDFVHSEYEVARAKLSEEMARLPQSC